MKNKLLVLALAFSVLAGVGAGSYAVWYYEPGMREAQQEAKDKTQLEAVNILASERVAYYTKVLSIFTGALSAFGVIQVAFLLRADQTARTTTDAIKEQVKLARDEFEAAHRPWLAVRDARLDVGCLELGPFTMELTVEYSIENTGETPARDVILLGSLIPRHLEGEIAQIQRGHVENYRAIGRVAYTEKQTMIAFPGERPLYKSSLEMPWRDIETKEELTTLQMRDLLLVGVFIYSDSSGTSKIMYSSCVHQITNDMQTGAPNAAKAGTGILMDGQISRWAVGWDAT